MPSPSSPVPSSSVSTSPVLTVTVQPNAQSNNPGVTVGAVVGSGIGGTLLTIGSFLFYKRYKNNEEQNKAIHSPGDSYSNEASQIPTESVIYYQGQQEMPPFQVQNHGQENVPNIQVLIHNHGQENDPNIQEPIYNHGQVATPNIQDSRSPVLNDDQNSFQKFKNEILQAVREEVDKRMTRNL